MYILGKYASSEVISLCEIRQTFGRSCKDCIYYGKPCEKIKRNFGVKKPYELLDMEEQINGSRKHNN